MLNVDACDERGGGHIRDIYGNEAYVCYFLFLTKFLIRLLWVRNHPLPSVCDLVYEAS